MRKSLVHHIVLTMLVMILMVPPVLAQSGVVGKIYVDEKGNVTELPLENTVDNIKNGNSNDLQNPANKLEPESTQNTVIKTSNHIMQSNLSDTNNFEVKEILIEKANKNKYLYEKPQPDIKNIIKNRKIIHLLNLDQIESFKEILIKANIEFENTGNYLYEFIIEEDGLNVLKRNKILYVVIGVEFIGEIINDNNEEKLENPMYIPLEDPNIYGSNTTDIDIPDKITDVGVAFSPITMSGATGPVTKVEYFVYVYHTYPSDLKIYLWNSSHEKIIWDRLGNTTDGGYDDDPEYDDDIYLNFRSTTFFNGDNPNRLWTLDCYDYAFLNKGYIGSWALRIYYEEPLPNLTPYGTQYLSVNGTTVSVSTTIKNTGNGDAGSSELGYYLSDNTTITPIDHLWETDYVTSLVPGATSPESETQDLTTVSPKIDEGTYYVGFFIDHKKEVTESNELDNAYYFSSPKATVVYKPNLTTYGTPSLSVNGTTVSLSTTIKNTGNANAGSSE